MKHALGGLLLSFKRRVPVVVIRLRRGVCSAERLLERACCCLSSWLLVASSYVLLSYGAAYLTHKQVPLAFVKRWLAILPT